MYLELKLNIIITTIGRKRSKTERLGSLKSPETNNTFWNVYPLVTV